MNTTIDQYDTYCEQHPDKLWPHDDCAGPGVPLTPERFRGACFYKRPITDDMYLMMWNDTIGSMTWAELQGGHPDIILGAFPTRNEAVEHAKKVVNLD